MARVYQEMHMIENLGAQVKALTTTTNELARSKGLQEERIKKLEIANVDLAKKNEALELRVKADEHNAAARLQNSLRASRTHPAPKPAPSSSNTSTNTPQTTSTPGAPTSKAVSTHPIPLTPLHDTSTNRPIRKLPKHEKDIRTMSPMEVIQALQALGVSTLGMGQGEKKGELRVQIGLPREG
ncbi:hypothetical protein MMC21_006118 [Puttea exsequens]|nr:hypothetical protein [Puttea exsequens]